MADPFQTWIAQVDPAAPGVSFYGVDRSLPVRRLDAIRGQAAAYPDGDLAWLLAQHDKAQATVSELGYKLDSAGHEWFETEKERDAARADLAALRRLALDAVTAVGLCPCTDPDGDCAKIRALSDALPPEAP